MRAEYDLDRRRSLIFLNDFQHAGDKLPCQLRMHMRLRLVHQYDLVQSSVGPAGRRKLQIVLHPAKDLGILILPCAESRKLVWKKTLRKNPRIIRTILLHAFKQVIKQFPILRPLHINHRYGTCVHREIPVIQLLEKTGNVLNIPHDLP